MKNEVTFYALYMEKLEPLEIIAANMFLQVNGIINLLYFKFVLQPHYVTRGKSAHNKNTIKKNCH